MSNKKTHMEFGDRLKVIRKRMGISQKEIAAKIGMAVSTYQHYERGEREAPVSVLPKIASFGFSLEWLLEGKGDPVMGCSPTVADNDTDRVLQIHRGIIERFQDGDRALDANSDLLEIERTDPALFREICAYIKGMANGIRYTAKAERVATGEDQRRSEGNGLATGTDGAPIPGPKNK